jgi:hypothetical protein
VIRLCLKYKCVFAWNIQDVSDVEECKQWKALKYLNIIFDVVLTVHLARKPDTQPPSSTPYRQLENQALNTTGSNHLYNTLELLMMGIMVPETC